MPPYSLDSLQNDCYENSTILKNKFNIRNENQLNVMEQSITSMLLAKAMFDIPFKNIDFEFYKNLHKYIFSDIYDWAGKIRTVNMSKNGTNFCQVEKIEEYGIRIFQRLNKRELLKNIHNDEFIAEFTDLYCGLNYLHPFREGNGRIQRLFLSMLVKHLGMNLNFSEINADYLMVATIKSISGDIFMLRSIFKEYIN